MATMTNEQIEIPEEELDKAAGGTLHPINDSTVSRPSKEEDKSGPDFGRSPW